MKTYELEFDNAFEAITLAQIERYHCVGWAATRKCWVVYNPVDGAPEGVTPDLLCIGPGNMPLPLSDEGMDIFKELIGKLKLIRGFELYHKLKLIKEGLNYENFTT